MKNRMAYFTGMKVTTIAGRTKQTSVSLHGKAQLTNAEMGLHAECQLLHVANRLIFQPETYISYTMALLEWQTGIITRIIDETHNTKRFFFELPNQTDFVFAPGQFVTLDLPIHEQKNKRWRSYSIASAPVGTNTFELIIVLNTEGAGTTWLWQHAVVGTELLLRGPQGKFVLPPTLDTDLYLICTGTGIAPFRSMAQYLQVHSVPHQQVYLIFGTRKLADTLYTTELQQLQLQLPSFQFIPVYSRETADTAPAQRIGYVHHVYEEIILQQQQQYEKAGGEGLKPAKFMLCGWKNMIDDARQRLQALGYEKKDIHFELYG